MANSQRPSDRLFAQSELDPARLEIEITESVLLEDTRANLAILQRLKEIGVRIALDDLGTSYSYMIYLRCFHSAG